MGKKLVDEYGVTVKDGNLRITSRQARSIAAFIRKKSSPRYMLECVHIESDSETLTIVATDSKAMAVYETPAKGLDEFSINIDKYLLLALVQYYRGTVDIATLRAMPQVPGTYPKYRELIPKKQGAMVCRYSSDPNAVYEYVPVGLNIEYIRACGAAARSLLGERLITYYQEEGTTAVCATVGCDENKLTCLVMPVVGPEWSTGAVTA